MSSECTGTNGPRPPGHACVAHVNGAVSNGGADDVENAVISNSLASLGWLPKQLEMQAQIHRNDQEAHDAPTKPTEAAAILDFFHAHAANRRAPAQWPRPMVFDAQDSAWGASAIHGAAMPCPPACASVLVARRSSQVADAKMGGGGWGRKGGHRHALVPDRHLRSW